MRSFLYVISALAVMSLAFWAYHENYETQEALSEVDSLQNSIADSRQTLAILRAEWAYLNRPARLRDLVMLNYDALGLLPLAPEQFARVEEVGYPEAPVAPEPPITDPVALSSTGQELAQ